MADPQDARPTTKTHLWLTAEQEHAIAELIGTGEASQLRIAPGLFDEDPVSLTFSGPEGERSYLIAHDGKSWSA